MEELLTHWQVGGLIVGLGTFLIIGIFHPLVIKGYYYFGLRCRPWFAVGAIAFCIWSMLCDSFIGSTLLGVTGFSCIWSIKEVNEQVQRVKKGWFPEGPAQKRSKKVEGTGTSRS